MNKYIFISTLVLIEGCASIKYPGWEQVKIENTVENTPCLEKKYKEMCIYSIEECKDWFRKRAVLVGANTVEMYTQNNGAPTGKYFLCKTGLPLYKAPKFIKEVYQSGSNQVTGQAFLRQRGGGIVTCAGKTVLMFPDSLYFKEYVDFDKNIFSFEKLDKEAEKLLQTGICDAQGNFEFYNIPDGKWIIETNVSWEVFSINNIGSYYYLASNLQGGRITRHVSVSNNKVNKFIITQ